MKNKEDNLLRSRPFTRRHFLKLTGMATGLYLTRRWLGKPSLVLADDPPRVVSVRNSNATNWDHATGYYWDYVNQEAVNSMVGEGVMTLTGALSTSQAWSALIPYQPGQSVAIKVNFNNCKSMSQGEDNDIDALPETVNAVIDGLLSIGIPPDKIWISDPSKCIPPRFINKINNPDVHYYSTVYCPSTYATDYVDANIDDGASPTTHPSGDWVRPAQVFVDANHIINIPLLKGHGSGWMTLGLKNHYGSVVFMNYPSESQGAERMRMHQYIYPSLNPDITKSLLADINNNPHIKGKTRLIIGDGLFGHPVVENLPPIKWQIFNDADPNIMFFGIDPIATDSVMLDYITEEQVGSVVHSSLQYGATLGLGIHDHWDGFETKIYSLIDYVNIDLDDVSVNRVDIDRKIEEFKAGTATEQQVKDLIEEYMEAPL